MNASPLPVAEVLPLLPGSGPSGSGATSQPADLQRAADPRGAADFAALLQSAGPTPEVLAPEAVSESVREVAPETVQGPDAPSSIDQLLVFLASFPSSGVASASTTTPNPVAPPAAEAMIPSMALPGADRAVHRGRGTATTTTLPLAVDPPAAAHAEGLAPVPAFAQGSEMDVEQSGLQALTSNANPVDSTRPARAGARTEAKFDPVTTLVLASSVPAVTRPAQETAGGEIKALVMTSTSPPDSTVSPPGTATAASPARLTVEIETPVHDPAWRSEVTGRIASLVTRGVEHAELRLSPAELGPVELRIDVRGGEATLAIFAAQASTRDALEQALPLLRDLLAQQGLSLGQASVQDGRADNPANGNGSAAARAAAFAETPAEGNGANAPDEPRPGLIRRLIDVFA